MKLIFDQNLSPKLVNRLVDLFPGSSHVQTEGLDCAGRHAFASGSWCFCPWTKKPRKHVR